MKKQWNKSIVRFLFAQTLSLLGSSIVQYAIVWYITLTTSSGVMLTISTLCGFLPQIGISFFAGVWIDRYDRKKMIMLSDTCIAAATLLLAIAFFGGFKSNLLLFMVLIIRSAGTGIQTPAVNAILPQIVPKEELMRINGINASLSSLILLLSPAISGAILSLAPLEMTLLIDVSTAIIGVGITSTISIAPYVRTENIQNTYFEEMKKGLFYLKEKPMVKHLIVYQILILFLISPSAFLTPLLVSRTYGSALGYLTASEMSYSLGMILGGLLIASWKGFDNKLMTTIAAGAFYGIMMIGIGISPIFLIYLVCNLLIGITSPCYNAPLTVLIQEKVEPEMHGRVFSFMQIASSCALPLGMLLFGPLADRFEPQQLLIVSGIMVIFVSGFAYFSSYFKKSF